jgi:HK97 family phage major capsid protein
LTASGGVASGGAVVQSTVLASQYIPPNYNLPVVVEAGARVLPGLQGNVLIPKMSAGKSGTWVNPENTAVTAADATFAQVSLSPKDFGTVADVSRRLLVQANPAVDGLVRDDIAMAIQLGVDAAALVGSGSSGQPTGVTGQAGVQTQPGGTNGAALSWANVTYLPQLVAAANRLVTGPSVGFITNAQAFYHAARTVKVSSYPTFIAQYDENSGAGIGARAGTILGRPVHISQQVPSNLVKGTSGAICSAMYFGNWADLLIGEWGVLDMLVDPYTFSNTGAIRIRAFVTIDIAVRYGASFSQIVDIITT